MDTSASEFTRVNDPGLLISAESLKNGSQRLFGMFGIMAYAGSVFGALI